ncbi:response regulator transcription factor [Pseudoflavitalea sp. X16]|uniref:LytR/AlgR family response regulator transcription factor n=1 Tax=Paraflavitalea devenefica TaxID=2716334 RepID=UPI00141DD712|nr:LytTR family DNA-binding domain-containing protein [Paraflavitalea devenefica]NII24879.1 response regulator transcription factor [Paraflavitalea devenefica]
MIRAIIVDDEPYCCEVLSTLLEKYCPEVTIEAICSSAKEAITAISTHSPQLVFLDIEMPHMNGFQLLERLPHIDFDLIFTTSYDQYAIKAIKFSALDYLLKPIDRSELQIAVRKAVDRLQHPLPQQLQILLQKLYQPPPQVSRVALPTMEGLQLVPLDTIISCASSSNYTIISLKDKQKIIVSRTLKEIEEMLEDYLFMRVHHSYLVNLNEIRKYIKGEGGNLIMSDGSSVDVSRSKKEQLLKKLQPGKS